MNDRDGQHDNNIAIKPARGNRMISAKTGKETSVIPIRWIFDASGTYLVYRLQSGSLR